MQLKTSFFNRNAASVARELLGRVILHRYQNHWLAARIIETEAYYQNEKGSHASLGYTEKRRALFMPAGTIYMYYARGKDSFNVSCRGEGDAVLIKSAFPFESITPAALKAMQRLNPTVSGEARPIEKLCAGQTLLCRALNLKVPDWDQQSFDSQRLFIDDTGYQPDEIVQAPRLGIPTGRDEHLMLRFIDLAYAKYCTRNPLTQRNTNYRLFSP
ncbi:MAG TPA: DNA-3-methyladenine glycosylase [Gammaproteobacteria bacterium]|nr:DNA-3-methyladenine glycosylase [Gammaproteobacteria bacterium]